MNYSPVTIAAALAWLLVPTLLVGAAEKTSPDRYGIIFQLGYAGDHFPKDDAVFEKLVESIKKAHFNVILAKYTPERAAICKRHGVQLMVDLLVDDHHVYKNPDGAEALCRRLRDSDVVYAYHLWSDRVGGTVAGRIRDVTNVRAWDPNHPAYVGDYHARSIGAIENADLVGYYDFHWKRGGHFRHLIRAWNAARKIDAPFLRYTHADPGRIGHGNYNRVLYTISTANACGQKGYTYHYADGLNKQTGEWGPLMHDLAKVNAEVVHLGEHLMQIGLPTAVYSTPITRTAKDRDVQTPAVPSEFQSLPADHWFEVAKGEAIVSEFARNDGDTPVALANHNAYRVQQMTLRFTEPPESVRLLDRKTGRWQRLTVDDRSVSFDVAPAACELLRVRR